MHIELPEKRYYKIGEVAKAFNVNTSLIRFWEKEFTQFVAPRKNPKGTRSYTDQDIENLKMIYHLLKVQGLTLSGAKKKIKDNKTSLLKTTELHSRLSNIKEELVLLCKGLTLPSDSSDF